METNKEESIVHEPLLALTEASCSRVGAASRVGSRWQGDGEEEGRETFITSLDSGVFVPGLQKPIQQPPWGNLEGLKASSIVSNSWIEIKGHKGLDGVDEHWV